MPSGCSCPTRRTTPSPSSTASTMAVTNDHPGRRPPARHRRLVERQQRTLYICTSDSDHIEVLDLADAAPSARSCRAVPTRSCSPSARMAPRCISPTRTTTMVSVLDLEIGPGSRPRSRSAWNPRAWASAPTAGRWSIPPRRPAWRISSTPPHIRSIGNVLVGSRPRVARFTMDGKPKSGSPRKLAAPFRDDRRDDTRKVTHTIEFAIPGVPAESVQPVGIAHDARTASTGVRGARPGQPRCGSGCQDLRGPQSTCSSGQRVWNLAFSQRRQAPVRHQRGEQRLVGDRR